MSADIEVINKADLLIAQLTQSISLLYKPLLFITTCFGFTLGNVWTVVINAVIYTVHRDPTYSEAGAGIAWAFALLFAMIVYVPIYFFVKRRTGKKSVLVKVQNAEDSAKDIGKLDPFDALKSIEQGIVDMCFDKIIDVLTFIALSAVVNALLIGNPIIEDPGLWALVLGLIFTAGTCLLVFIYKKIDARFIEEPRKKIVLGYLVDITVSNMSQILAVFYASALQYALMENRGLSESTVALAWVIFLIIFGACLIVVFIKDRKARKTDRELSRQRISEAAFDEKNGKLKEAAQKVRLQVTLFFNKLRTIEDMLTTVQILFYKGFLYMSAVAFNNAVLTSIADAATEDSKWKNFETLGGSAHFTYAAVINLLGIILIHTLVNRISKRANQPTLILLHNEFIDLFSYALAFLCGRAWAEAFKRSFQTGQSRIWNNFAVAFVLTLIFILLNAFLLRYYPKNARNLIEKINREQHEEKENSKSVEKMGSNIQLLNQDEENK
jgi:ABC-type multidrug transport system fused ATPase/permease subunit